MSARKTNTKWMDNPYVLMGLLLVLWGSFAAASKFALQSLDSFQVQFYMFGSALVVMTVIFVANGRMRSLLALPPYAFRKLIVYAIPSYLYYFLYIMALQLVPAIEASMLNYMFPILIVALSVPMQGEKLSFPIVASVIVGFAGMVVIVTGGDFSDIRLTNWKGDLLALGAAFCWALFSNWGKRNEIDSDLSNYMYTFVSFVLAAVSLVLFSDFRIPAWEAGAWVVWIGLSNIVFTYYLWFRGLKSSSSALIASLSFLTPFFTLLFIVWLLKEPMKPAQWVGLLLIVAGIAIQMLGERWKSRKVSNLSKKAGA
ncbi:DMT family transporter [Paenibacillus koleovorans]|uniref:DMT family transporter n=1 Tax=Paenibacillus koleovorans TaxID=121608 RepID=UPI000FDB938F|nr:DMT family transporter [Paenibacillus koleovorans]